MFLDDEENKKQKRLVRKTRERLCRQYPQRADEIKAVSNTRILQQAYQRWYDMAFFGTLITIAILMIIAYRNILI